VTAPADRADTWTAQQAIADLLDVIAVTDRREPVWRFLSTDRIREIVTGGRR
jgi:hypothetical protein